MALMHLYVGLPNVLVTVLLLVCVMLYVVLQNLLCVYDMSVRYTSPPTWGTRVMHNFYVAQVTSAMQLKGHQASVLSVSFSSDSQRFVYCCVQVLCPLQCVTVYFTFSFTKRMASVSKDGSLKIWDINGAC